MNGPVSKVFQVSKLCTMSNQEQGGNPIRIMICELLCYATEYIQCTTKEALGKTIHNFYDLEEIIEAKTMLCKQYGETLGEFPQRKTSPNRSEKAAHTEDILCALLKLDEDGIDCKFAAVKIKRLPRWDPNELDAVSFLEKMNILERRLNSLEINVSENKADLIYTNDKMETLTAKVSHNENEIKDIQPRLPTYAEKTSINLNKSSVDFPTFVQDAEEAKNIEKSTNRDPLQLNTMSKSIYKTKEKPVTSVASDVSNLKNVPVQNRLLRQTGNEADNETDASDGFEMPRGERRRQNRQRRKQNFVAGTAAVTQLRGAPPPGRDYFVYRVDKSAQSTDIIDHLLIHGIQVRDIKLLCHVDSKFNSFKVSVTVTDATKMMAAETWPDGVRVRRYVRKTQNVRNDGP